MICECMSKNARKKIKSLYLVVVFLSTLFFLMTVLSFGEEKDKLSTVKTQQATKPQRVEDKDKHIPSLKRIKLKGAGLLVNLLVYIDEEGDLFVPLKDVETYRLINHFKCIPTYLVPLNTVVLGFKDGADFRMKIGERVSYRGRKKIELKKAPFLKDGIPFIPIEALEKTWLVKMGYNKETHTYYLDPIVKDVSIVKGKGKLILKIEATGPVKYTTSILENPKRFVIDVDGAFLDESLVDKDIYNAKVGSLFVSQQSYNPNKVRIVIPLNKGIEVEMAGIEKYTISANLFLPQVVAPVQGLSQERITDLRYRVEPDRVVFKVLTTGPVQYEWRRLLPPDNRFFVDIPNCIYTPRVYAQNFDVGYLKSIRVYQYRPLPNPVVRVALELNVPSKVKVGPDPQYPGEIRIDIFSKTINPQRVERQGFGITQYASRGVVICIDPGHGGSDPGACHHGLVEKKLTLDIALRLAKLLRKSGWNVVMTRTVDRDVSFAGSSDIRELSSRVAIANQTHAQIFVSIHIDASVNYGQNGTTTYYYHQRSLPLAMYVQKNLVASNGRRNLGVRQASFYVIRHTRMPSILVECAYISNPTEASLLSSPSFRQKCAEGIYRGLMEYARAKKISGLKPISPKAYADKIVKRKTVEIERRLEDSTPQGLPSYNER